MRIEKKQWNFSLPRLDSLSLLRSENNETHEELFKQIGHDYTVTVYIYAMSP